MVKKVKQNTRRTPEAALKTLQAISTLTSEDRADLIDPFESVEASIEPKQSTEYDPVDFEDRLFDIDRSASRANRAM